MVDRSSVKDHFLKMMSYLNGLEILRAAIDKESQVEGSNRLYRIVFNSFASIII